MKPKSALVKDGFLPVGSENKRGRLSAAAIKRCEELAAQGWKIDGFTAEKVADETKVKKTAKPDPNRVVDVPDEARAESLWRAYADEKEIGMRTVCNNCGNSLTYCRDRTPVVWVDHDRQAVVSFKPRKG